MVFHPRSSCPKAVPSSRLTHWHSTSRRAAVAAPPPRRNLDSNRVLHDSWPAQQARSEVVQKQRQGRLCAAHRRLCGTCCIGETVQLRRVLSAPPFRFVHRCCRLLPGHLGAAVWDGIRAWSQGKNAYWGRFHACATLCGPAASNYDIAMLVRGRHNLLAGLPEAARFGRLDVERL